MKHPSVSNETLCLGVYFLWRYYKQMSFLMTDVCEAYLSHPFITGAWAFILKACVWLSFQHPVLFFLESDCKITGALREQAKVWENLINQNQVRNNTTFFYDSGSASWKVNFELFSWKQHHFHNSMFICTARVELPSKTPTWEIVTEDALWPRGTERRRTEGQAPDGVRGPAGPATVCVALDNP